MVDASDLNQWHIAIMAPSYHIAALQLSAVMVITEAVSAIFVVRVTFVSGILLFLLMLLLDQGATWGDSKALSVASAGGGLASEDDSDIATVAKYIATATINV